MMFSRISRIFTVFCALALLFSLCALPASASSLDMSLVMSLDPPDDYNDRKFYEFEYYDDMASGYVGEISEGAVYYQYIYLKEEDYNPHFTVKFEIEDPGTYDFLIECMAYATDIPRTSILQIDDGELIYITSLHGDRHLITEYYTGWQVELEPGTHTMSVFLAEDFDNVTVKSLFFDCFSFINLTPPADQTETETEAPTDAPTETVTAAPTDVPTDAPTTDAPTAGVTQAPATDAADTPKKGKGCGATLGIASLLLPAVAAAIIRKRED